MFNSGMYDGPHQNPGWYIHPSDDPILEVYELYDRVVADIIAAIPDARILIATGLRQVPFNKLTFYWRLTDYATFLRKIGVPFARVEARMSRDFVIFNSDAEQAREAEARLNDVASADGTKLFAVDNRGDSLFVEFVWPHDISDDFQYRAGNVSYDRLKEDVTFISMKNGEHDGTGFVIDTAKSVEDGAERFALAELPARIAAGVGARWPA
jgi:hypothetical protein